MKNKLTKIIIFALSILGLFGLTSAPVLADNVNCIDICSSDCSVPQAVKDAQGCRPDVTPSAESVAIKIINGVIAVLGIVAVVFIIVGGVQYMTSTGDPGKTKKAKDTILYAAIGLIICVLSFAIVNFIIKNLIGG